MGRLSDVDHASEFMKSVVEFYEVVAQRATEKKPGTSKFIAMVAYLRAAGHKTKGCGAT